MRTGHQTRHPTHRDIDHPALAELTKTLKPTTMPKQPVLMQCTLVAEPFDDPDWISSPSSTACGCSAGSMAAAWTS